MWQGSWVHPWNWVNTTAEISCKVVINYLQSWEISSKTTLLEIGSAKCKSWQLSWPKVKFQEDFLIIFHFTLPFFQALFNRWINNKLKVILITIFSSTLLYTIKELLWDNGGSIPLEIPWISNATTEGWLISSGKPVIRNIIIVQALMSFHFNVVFLNVWYA